MTKLSFALIFAVTTLPPTVGAPHQAQAPLSVNPSSNPPDPTVYVSSHQIAERLAEAVAANRSSGPGESHFPVLTQQPFAITAVARHGAGEALTDETNADLYVVLEGSGTMNVGGHLIEPKRLNAALTGSRTEGGVAYELAKGDLLMVPPNTPQSISRTEGTLAMMEIHVPIGNTNLWPGGNGFFAATGDPNLYISAQEITDRMAKADAAIAAGLPDRGPFTLLNQPPYRVTMDDRIIPNGHVDGHPQSAELFYVLDGSGTMVVGGTLQSAKGGGNDLMAPSTQGGTLYKVAKGDLVLVPIGAAHAVITVNSKLTMMQVHIPPPVHKGGFGGPGGPGDPGAPSGPGGHPNH